MTDVGCGSGQVPPRILVVDDEPDLLQLLGVAMTSLRSYEVTLASSASAALRHVSGAHRPFDVLVLDMQMPKMGGLELLDRIRRNPRHADAAVIMLTAMCDKEHVQAAWSKGIFDYVTKPFDYDDVLHRIDAACGIRPGGGGGAANAVQEPEAPLRDVPEGDPEEGGRLRRRWDDLRRVAGRAAGRARAPAPAGFVS
ncbi:response regulator [Roseibacterium sp. SDUM158017]|uniref:response regulator n=1 Tax=Roseicyclus salinarum TaxID=3036773 RepID=UPI0024157D12|nr:response regulator [Roseibacterium sp. SDUM158017]MDG4650209.1 response regulator [Roseibacterium sp. SDUM158017]